MVPPTESLVVAGYDVRGEVFGEGDPIRGVHFVLASGKSKTATKMVLRGCEGSPPRGFSLPTDLHFLCSVTSGEDGQFMFPAVPPGSYKLLPFYKAERIEFDIAPRQAVFSVKHGGHRFPSKFQASQTARDPACLRPKSSWVAAEWRLPMPPAHFTSRT
ncbi:hypothetical protein MRX96_017506 [Rhipicephalus microplus]